MGNNLGLSSWAAGVGERRLALISVLAFALAAAGVTPVAAVPLPESLPLVGMILGASVAGSAIAGLLLAFQAWALQSMPTAALAAGFFYAAATIVPFTAIFPGMFPALANFLDVRPAAAGLLWFSWHVGLLASMLAFGFLRRAPRTDPTMRRRARAFIIAIAVAFVFSTVAVLWVVPLPPAFEHRRWSPFVVAFMVPSLVVLALAVIAATVRRGERATVLDLWLAVVAFAMIVAAWLTLAGGTPYTAGWYASRTTALLAITGLVGVLLRQAAKRYVALEHRARVLENEAHTDTLTGLPNRRRFDEEFIRAFGSAVRREGPLALAIADIDRFKHYNDALGHQAGDRALHAIGRAIADAVGRSGDFAARYGGEEFVVILEDTMLDGAAGVAERIRKAVSDADIVAPTGTPLTVSVGVASRRPGESRDDLLRHADEALYFAKGAGRNRVCTAAEMTAAGRRGRSPLADER